MRETCTIAALLRLSYGLGLDLDRLMLDDIASLKPKLRKIREPRRETLSDAEVTRRITDVLGKSGKRPLTMNELCNEAGINRRRVQRRLPEIWRSLVQHFATLRNRNVEIREKRWMRRAVEFIRQRGPSVGCLAIQDAAGINVSENKSTFTAEARRIEAHGQLEFSLND